MAEDTSKDSFDGDNWTLDDDVSLLDEAEVNRRASKEEPEPEPESFEPVDSGLFPEVLAINVAFIDGEWQRFLDMGDEFVDEEEAAEEQAKRRALEEAAKQEEDVADSGLFPPVAELRFNLSAAESDIALFQSMGDEGWDQSSDKDQPTRAEQRKIDQDAEEEKLENISRQQFEAMFPNPPHFRIDLMDSQVSVFRQMGEEGRLEGDDDEVVNPRRRAEPEPLPEEAADSGILPPAEALVMQLSLDALPRMMKILGEESQPDD